MRIRPLIYAAVALASAAAVLVGGPRNGDAGRAHVMREPVGPALSSDARWPIDLIHLTVAWDVSIGASPGPLIAVIDTGVQKTSDLAGRVQSESLVGGTGENDFVGHGTEVAGIIAASGSDGTGAVGVCWTCRILSLQVSLDGSVDSDVIAKAIDRAIARGATVINLSLAAELHSITEREAIARAVNAGIVVVAAAGNDASLVPQFPAAYAGVLSVGAAGQDGKVIDFSSRGPWVSVLAPACGAPLNTHGHLDSGFCGTSASTAFVSGLAGLVQSVAPTAKGVDVIAAIQNSARALSSGSAHGLVDAGSAVALIKKIKPGSSGPVKAALVRSLRPPAVTGAARVKARLTASTGAWSGPLTSVSLRWQRCTKTGSHCKTVGWGSTYRVAKADRGHGVHVVARAVGQDNIGVDAASRLLVIRR